MFTRLKVETLAVIWLIAINRATTVLRIPPDAIPPSPGLDDRPSKFELENNRTVYINACLNRGVCKEFVEQNNLGHFDCRLLCDLSWKFVKGEPDPLLEPHLEDPKPIRWETPRFGRHSLTARGQHLELANKTVVGRESARTMVKTPDAGEQPTKKHKHHLDIVPAKNINALQEQNHDDNRDLRKRFENLEQRHENIGQTSPVTSAEPLQQQQHQPSAGEVSTTPDDDKDDDDFSEIFSDDEIENDMDIDVNDDHSKPRFRRRKNRNRKRKLHRNNQRHNRDWQEANHTTREDDVPNPSDFESAAVRSLDNQKKLSPNEGPISEDANFIDELFPVQNYTEDEPNIKADMPNNFTINKDVNYPESDDSNHVSGSLTKKQEKEEKALKKAAEKERKEGKVKTFKESSFVEVPTAVSTKLDSATDTTTSNDWITSQTSEASETTTDDKNSEVTSIETSEINETTEMTAEAGSEQTTRETTPNEEDPRAKAKRKMEKELEDLEIGDSAVREVIHSDEDNPLEEVGAVEDKKGRGGEQVKGKDDEDNDRLTTENKLKDKEIKKRFSETTTGSWQVKKPTILSRGNSTANEDEYEDSDDEEMSTEQSKPTKRLDVK